jgi:hypothetical protein
LGRGAFWNFVTAFVANDHPLTRAQSPLLTDPFSSSGMRQVVEPFTGEEFYALASGEPAADAIISQTTGRPSRNRGRLPAAHAQLYRGRLWINRARTSRVMSAVASILLEAARFQPALLRLLTAKSR